MFTVKEKNTINKALEIVASKFLKTSDKIESVELAKTYVTLKIATLEHEVFVLIHLNTQHQVISVEELFRGTIDQAAVYPREVVKSALRNNSAAIILAHNHPSGIAEPSQADIRITKKLMHALETVDISVLDHIIVGATETVSLNEAGLL